MFFLATTFVAASALGLADGAVYVSPSGTDSGTGTKDDPFRTFNQALAQVHEDGVIYGLPGVYSDIPTINKAGISILASPASPDAASTHVFSGLNKYPTTGLSVNMNGTTIRGFGFRQTRGYASSYGAVYVSIKGGLTIEDCIFTDNSIGISVLSGSATIRNCHFDTHTTSSSGMDGTGTAVAFMYSDFSGGGVVNVANSTFAGPGLAFKVNDGPAVLQVNDSSFEDLWGVASSGYLNGVMDLQVRTSSFKNVTQAFRLYGMQSPAKGLVGIDSCEFRSGGGASVNGGVVTVGADIAVAIKNSSFVGHQGLQGAVLNCQDQASVTVLDSTFAGNSAEDGSPGWCSKSCGFVAANNVLSKNSEHKDTGPCAGLNTA